MAAKQRQGVAKGGMWNTHSPSYSKETQELLKVMMKESKLNNFQMRQLQKTMKDGGSLPTTCHPTTSAKPAQPAPPKQMSARVDPCRSQGLRSKEEIESSGAYEREQYIPGPTRNLEKEKNKLQNYMAYGEDIPPITEQRKQEILRIPSPEPEVDPFTVLEAEIQERVEFLEDMKKLGREREYKTIISTEISQKIREMEIIDKKRTKELKKAIEERDRQRGEPEQGTG